MSDAKTVNVRFPILGSPLFLVLLVLKLTNTITWSWWWITAPLWVPFGLFSLIMVVAAFIALIIALVGK